MEQDQTKTKGCSLRVEIEKLDGGFISNISGKRRIYKNSVDIDEAIDIKDVLDKMDENEYMLNIDLVPKEQYIASISKEAVIDDAFELNKITDSNLSILEQAKKDGVIQPAEKFNPNKLIVSDALPKEPCYSIAQLNAVPWKKYDDEVPLTIREKSDIAGIIDSTMYNLWPKVAGKTFQWQSIKTKEGMTKLAKYYEKATAPKPIPAREIPTPRNDKRLMEVVTEIELMCKSSMVKSTMLLKKVEQFKKLLIQD